MCSVFRFRFRREIPDSSLETRVQTTSGYFEGNCGRAWIQSGSRWASTQLVRLCSYGELYYISTYLLYYSMYQFQFGCRVYVLYECLYFWSAAVFYVIDMVKAYQRYSFSSKWFPVQKTKTRLGWSLYFKLNILILKLYKSVVFNYFSTPELETTRPI